MTYTTPARTLTVLPAPSPLTTTIVPTTTPTTLPAASGSVSLDGSTIDIQSSGEAQFKLACTDTGPCAGKVTLSAKATAKKGKGGKKAKAATKTIGTATFSIPPGETAIIELKLHTPGRALLSAAHGRLSAALTVLKSFPSPLADKHRQRLSRAAEGSW